LAEEKALVEAAARKEAEKKAFQEALEQAKAEAAAKKASEEKALALAAGNATPPTGTGPSLEIANLKSKVTNVDIVNRSIDRSQMTIGVEYEYKDNFGSKASMGVDVLRQSEPQVAGFFKGTAVEVGKSRRNFVLFPVKFTPPAGVGADASGFPTDKVLVYLSDSAAQRHNLYAATMLLMWRAPGSANVAAPVASATHTIDFDDFKQNDASNGYVSIRYHLLSGKGRLRVSVFDSANPGSRDYFARSAVDVNPGRGIQTLEVKVEPDSKSPTDFVRADTIEIEMIDSGGNVLAKTSKRAAMAWSKPKQ
jgi:hypothetical protein